MAEILSRIPRAAPFRFVKIDNLLKFALLTIKSVFISILMHFNFFTAPLTPLSTCHLITTVVTEVFPIWFLIM